MRIDINFYAREKSMQDMMWPRQDANIMDYGKESLCALSHRQLAYIRKPRITCCSR